LKFDADQPHPSIEKSPIRPLVRRGAKSTTPADIYELQPTPEPRGEKRSYEDTIAENEEEDYANGFQDESMVMVGDDGGVELEDGDDQPYNDGGEYTPVNLDEEDSVVVAHSSPTVQRKGRGRPSKATEKLTNGILKKSPKGRGRAKQQRESFASTASDVPKKRGRPPKVKDSFTNGAKPDPSPKKQKIAVGQHVDSDLIDPSLEEVDTSQISVPQGKRKAKGQPALSKARPLEESSGDEALRDYGPGDMLPPPRPNVPRGGKFQKSKLHIHEEASGSEDVDEVRPPAKRSKITSKAVPRAKAGVSERDPNLPIRSTSKDADEQPMKRSLWGNGTSRPMPRTLQILRQGTPSDEASLVTRSGRRSVRPLAYWHGEAIERAHDGTMLNIVRAESVEVESKRSKKKPGRRKAPAMAAIEEEEVDDEDLEQWEIEGRIIPAFVRAYDPEYGILDEEDELGKRGYPTSDFLSYADTI
jgi:hypothetical protein